MDKTILINEEPTGAKTVLHKPLPNAPTTIAPAIPKAHFRLRLITMRFYPRLCKTCAGMLDDIMAESLAIRQSKTILARSCEAGRGIGLRLSYA